MSSGAKKRIGKYLIFQGNLLGTGAFSEVYLGIDEETKAEVAVKVVKKDKINEDEYTKNAFYSEIMINKKLKSPNIIKFYDVHETLNNFYIILELAQTGTLRSSLRKAKRFDEKTTMKYLFQILNGFGELIKNGITHRDLKPENILVKEKELKLADFGFAKQAQNNSVLQTMVGTISYMAPQILNAEKYTYKCDIWSLGVMTYEMLVGQVPWIFTDKSNEGFRKEILTR
jgi:serine/threonine protein kinase